MYIPKYSPLWRDYCLGLRCKYLILYGVLPAALISLGAVKVESITLPPTDEIVRLIVLLIIACIPMCLTYLLIKYKVDQYYLIKKCDIKRALFITSIILFAATIISILGRYSISSHPTPWELQPFIKYLLTAAIGLYGSSAALALTTILLGKNIDIPGLPGKSYVDQVSSIKKCMSVVTKDDRLIWHDKKSKEEIKQLVSDIAKCIKNIEELKESPLKDEKGFINQLSKDMDQLKTCTKDVYNVGANWQMYFAKYYDTNYNGTISKRAAIKRIHNTNWGVK